MKENKVLSICIASMDRQNDLLELLRLLKSQSKISEVEIVVVDSSVTSSEEIRALLLEIDGVYHWTGVAAGVDADFDLSVSIASGTYCWLLPDDDVVDLDAVAKVISATENFPDLILANARVRNLDLDFQLKESLIAFKQPIEIVDYVDSRNLAPFVALLTYIGSVIIKREVWKRAPVDSFFGTEFVHIGVILSQLPLSGLVVISEPVITIRYGQGYWEKRFVKVWWQNWENLIKSSLTESADQIRWNVMTGWKRTKDAAAVKALNYTSNRDVLNRLAADKSKSPSLWLAKWMIVVTPAVVINFSLSVLMRFSNSDSKEIRLFDLRRRRFKH